MAVPLCPVLLQGTKQLQLFLPGGGARLWAAELLLFCLPAATACPRVEPGMPSTRAASNGEMFPCHRGKLRTPSSVISVPGQRRQVLKRTWEALREVQTNALRAAQLCSSSRADARLGPVGADALPPGKPQLVQAAPQPWHCPSSIFPPAESRSHARGHHWGRGDWPLYRPVHP